MRQITLDTKTTGLDPDQGHRIIEIGGVEMQDRRLTGRHLHLYLDPEREVDEGAARVHGMTWKDLKGKPRFAQVVDEILAFCQGAEVIIHNARFDLGFLNAELARLGRGTFVEEAQVQVIDSLLMAREQFPGKRNSLDALCERLMVPNQHRTLHGALLDSELLADVYLGLTRGQESLVMETAANRNTASDRSDGSDEAWPPGNLRVVEPSAAERADHEAMLAAWQASSRTTPLWRRTDDPIS